MDKYIECLTIVHFGRVTIDSKIILSCKKINDDERKTTFIFPDGKNSAGISCRGVWEKFAVACKNSEFRVCYLVPEKIVLADFSLVTYLILYSDRETLWYWFQVYRENMKLLNLRIDYLAYGDFRLFYYHRCKNGYAIDQFADDFPFNLCVPDVIEILRSRGFNICNYGKNNPAMIYMF